MEVEVEILWWFENEDWIFGMGVMENDVLCE